MKCIRIAAVTAVAIGILGTSSRAVAQIGPWSQQYPAWVDANRDGVVNTGERNVYPEAVWNPQLPTSDPNYLYIVLVNNPWDACPGHIESRINATPLMNPQTIARRRGDVTQTVTGTLPSFSFSETIPDPPARAATAGRTVKALLVTANGGASFSDTNGDGGYDRMTVGGQKGATAVPQTTLDFVYRDVNADGKNDYVSLPWALTGVLGVKTTNDCVGGPAGAPQIWLPLADGNGDGAPDTVDVVFPDPRTPGAVGGIDGPPISAAADAGFPIPSASTLGLAAFAAALVGAGAFLLRAPGA